MKNLVTENKTSEIIVNNLLEFMEGEEQFFHELKEMPEDEIALCYKQLNQLITDWYSGIQSEHKPRRLRRRIKL